MERTKLYGCKLSKRNYKRTYLEVFNSGVPSTAKSPLPMRMLGSTCGASGCPKFLNPKTKKHSMIPRLFGTSREGQPGGEILKQSWLLGLTKVIDNVLMAYLKGTHGSPHGVRMYEEAKEKIDPILRIGDSGFTTLALVNDLTDGRHYPHVDVNDLFNVILVLGDKVEGGSTRYYGGKNPTDPGAVKHEVPHEHLRFQVGPF